MAEPKLCPICKKGNVYVLVSGKLVCRKCGYDERKTTLSGGNAEKEKKSV